MKREQIKVGNKYTDNKGNIREVLNIGSKFLLYSGQANNDCLRYKLIAKKRGPNPIGYVGNCTMIAFCSWAKKEV
jgi:hypothetical protein